MSSVPANIDIAQAQKFWVESDFVLQLLKQIPASVFWKDRDSVYLGCNDAFIDSLGLSHSGEIIGKTDYDLPTAKEESHAFRADDKQVMETKQAKLGVEEYQTLPDGRKIALLTNKVPLFDKQSNVVGILGVYYDITERKKKEEELREAKEKAESANRAKTEFLSAMVGELREVLSNEKTAPKALLNRLVNDIEHFANYDLNKDNASLEFVESVSSGLVVAKKQTNSSDLLRAHKIFGLSKRESECAHYLTRGMTMKLIAKAMGLSPRTVEFYIENMKDKLCCNTKSELIARLLDVQG